MVFYYTSNAVTPPATIYMGRDKFENEDLIKYGTPTDVWFHVDKFSSAHVYLRMESATQDWKSIDPLVLADIAQLTKANSIEGNKKSNVNIIYTPWSNLKKTRDMDVGTIGFKSDKLVKSIFVKERDNAIVNRLEKTKIEKIVDHERDAIDRNREEQKRKRAEEKRILEEELALKKERQALKDQKSYKSAMKKEHMRGNVEAVDKYAADAHDEVDVVNAFEDDFM